jgi:hypothetical protein
MDKSFQLRARRLLDGRDPAPLDFSMLTASLSAQAGASAAARAQARAAPPAEPIGEIVLGGTGWREAVCAQRGCFNRAEARRRGNES